ncbi:class E sortase [Nocardioides sp. GY 10113]|nr:class E sortase [Nocardioides sp. GY 10113]
MLFGLLLIATGLSLLGWLGWQVYGTNWQSAQKQDEVTQEIEEAWQSGRATATTDFGDATAILHVARFGKDYAVPVLEGSTDEVLAAGIGHVEGTGKPGKVGNYVLAAHRVTHGEPFAEFPSLRPGDEVVVETRKATYTYVLDSGGEDLILPFTETWVLEANPKNPNGGVQPPAGVGKRLITLVTCSEIFHTDNRSIVFGHLVERTPVA